VSEERSIIFTGPEVTATLAGRKTMMRRAVEPQPGPDFKLAHLDGGGAVIFWTGPVAQDMAAFTKRAYPKAAGLRCPFGAPGDRLWVKEAFSTYASPSGAGYRMGIEYVVDDASQYVAEYICDTKGWRDRQLDGEAWEQWLRIIKRRPGDKHSARSMRRWASRLTLELRDVRVERLHAISPADAAAEGLDFMEPNRFAPPGGMDWMSHDAAYQLLWDYRYGKRHPWASNDFVWVGTFKRSAE
jgi:hypothetical protein